MYLPKSNTLYNKITPPPPQSQKKKKKKNLLQNYYLEDLYFLKHFGAKNRLRIPTVKKSFSIILIFINSDQHDSNLLHYLPLHYISPIYYNGMVHFGKFGVNLEHKLGLFH